ncbi:MAG: ABC transporter substrate-binding protein [Nitrospinota bacterium]|nr:MAG: ABC transporter substrate-binding protein [Nitrospinota bacterium]
MRHASSHHHGQQRVEKMTRRRFFKTTVAASIAVAGSLSFPQVITPAKGAEKSIKIGIWAGPDGQLIKSTVVKRFEEKHRVKIYIDEGWTTQQLARLRASKNNPTHTVMFMDDIGVNLARKEGLVEHLPEDKIPNLAHVFPRYLVEEGYGVGIQVSTVALTYSTVEVKEAPVSWEAFWDPRYKGRISVPSITGTHGLNLVVIAAALETGKPFQEAQYETEAAFKKLARLKPNLHSIWSKTALAVAAMQQGELAMMGPMYSKFIWPYIDRGLQARHIIPREGAFAGLNCQTLVKGGPYPELGAAFINDMLSAETQQMLAQKLSVAPVIRGLELPSRILERVAYEEEKQKQLFTSDWEFINTIRPEWTERWNKIFA